MSRLKQPESTMPDNGDHANDDDDEAWYRDRFGGADVWVIAPGSGACMWREFRERGIVAISFRSYDLGNLSKYRSKDAIRSALIESGAGENRSQSTLALWEFAHKMKIGDILLAKKGTTAILGWGKVTGDYTYEPERVEYRHLRKVEWHPCRTPISLNDRILPIKTLTRFSAHKKWLRGTFRSIDDNGDPPPPKPVP